MAEKILRILQSYDNGVSKEQICDQLNETIEDSLQKIGINSLKQLTSFGMIAVLCYIYGADLISPKVIEDFIKHPERRRTNHYDFKFVPSEEEDTIVRIKIDFELSDGLSFNL